MSDCTTRVGEGRPKNSVTADRRKYFPGQKLCRVKPALAKDNEKTLLLSGSRPAGTRSHIAESPEDLRMGPFGEVCVGG